MRETQSNVRLFQIFAFLNRLELWDAVYVLFLLDRGFSLAQYGILDSLWYVGTLLFEVPTGALTDRYGKRISLFLSVLSQSLLAVPFSRCPSPLPCGDSLPPLRQGPTLPSSMIR